MNKLVIRTSDHEYRLMPENRRLFGVTEVLKIGGLIDDRWFTEAAAWRGSVVHEHIARLAENKAGTSTMDLPMTGYLMAYKRFCRESGFVVKSVETPRHDTLYDYAGTPDQEGVLNGHSAVVDFKTGTILPATAIQLAAYARLVAPHLEVRRFAVRLFSRGRYSVVECRDRTDWHVFQAALTLATWKKNHGLLPCERRRPWDSSGISTCL